MKCIYEGNNSCLIGALGRFKLELGLGLLLAIRSAGRSRRKNVPFKDGFEKIRLVRGLRRRKKEAKPRSFNSNKVSVSNTAFARNL